MRIEQLTFTRFIAALSIVIFHYGQGSYLFNNKYLSFIFSQADVGVSYFFILSGFVMIIAYYNKKDVPFYDFIKNRLARVYPVYFLAIFLLLILKINSTSLEDLFLNILMIQSWIPGKATSHNYPGWSLSTELFFYLSFPFLFNYIYKKLTLKTISYLIILFCLFFQILFQLIVFYKIIEIPLYSNRDLNYLPIMRLNEFLIGNLAGLFFIKKLNIVNRNYNFHVFGVIALLLLVFKFPIDLNNHNGLLSVIFVPLIIFISLSKGKLSELFNNKVFVFLGEISFGIYILQYPVWCLINDYRLNKYLHLDNQDDFTLGFFIRLFFLVGLSSLSYLYFEKPIRNKIKLFRTPLK
ncbi:acyltransferase family protein [Flavobacterium psychrotolerans]|uniref:Acyltransferase 3 domain-containing protein n=1 Tax=Flavobacterium psychrotolerans TaxID=2169410 RepID=A0A2U1JIL2_9FLAO|nr:acyltransferase [Flavobacterium psychrotolerans]PWA04844.1 hypothetical protein DB895_08745 [Flavobacterium psychrotolerans]